MCLYSAPWVIPVSRAPLSEGGVVVRDGKIVAVGKLKDLKKIYHNVPRIECGGILMPPLVNAHIHLELSHLTNIDRPGPGQRMTTWIENLLRQREEDCPEESYIQACMKRVIREQYETGCVLLVDIGNDMDREVAAEKEKPEIFSITEFLGPTQEGIKYALATLKECDNSSAVTAHAPYSTGSELICTLKKRSVKAKSIFSIHVAESPDEKEFVHKGTGPFRDFLEKRQAWDGTFPFDRSGKKGIIFYLDELGILDKNTLCVHCVHLEEDEFRLLVKRKASICLCPGSNQFLRVGKAPVETMLKCNILPAIGTDSTASNEQLNMWREMQILQKEHPVVPSSKIIEMATLGGARALHRDKDFGTLEPNKKARFLNIDLRDLQKIENGEELLENLVSSGSPQHITWIDHGKQYHSA